MQKDLIVILYPVILKLNNLLCKQIYDSMIGTSDLSCCHKQPVWPDVGVKSGLIFPNVAQCSFYIRVTFFKVAQKVDNHLSFFC